MTRIYQQTWRMIWRTKYLVAKKEMGPHCHIRHQKNCLEAHKGILPIRHLIPGMTFLTERGDLLVLYAPILEKLLFRMVISADFGTGPQGPILVTWCRIRRLRVERAVT